MMPRRTPFALMVAATAFLALAAPSFAITGGFVSRDPHGVRDVTVAITDGPILCTGTLIAETLVLTAAHCLDGPGEARIYGLLPDGRYEERTVAAAMRHPLYKPLGGERARLTMDKWPIDIAVIRLNRPMNAPFRPAELVRGGYQFLPGTPMRAAGFGVESSLPSKDRSDPSELPPLREVALVVGEAEMERIPVLRLVAGSPDKIELGRSVCKGDSGGPIFLGDAVSRTLAAVAVGATPVRPVRGRKQADVCGGATVILPVARHRDWIIEAARKLGQPIQP